MEPNAPLITVPGLEITNAPKAAPPIISKQFKRLPQRHQITVRQDKSPRHTTHHRDNSDNKFHICKILPCLPKLLSAIDATAIDNIPRSLRRVWQITPL